MQRGNWIPRFSGWAQPYGTGATPLAACRCLFGFTAYDLILGLCLMGSLVSH